MNPITLAFMVLLGFAIVGTMESRLRPLLRSQETQIVKLRADISRIEAKIDKLLGSSDDNSSSSPPTGN